MQALAYSSPATVDETLQLLGERARNPRVLAGGTDLLIQLRSGARDSQHLVDVKRIPEMNVLLADTVAGLRIGGGVPCTLVVEHAALNELYPGLTEATALIGSTQIQNRATLAGNLCNGSPAADTTPALLVLGATCVLAGPRGRREVLVDEMVTAPGETILGPGELLVEIAAAPPGRGSADAYQRFIPRSEMDIAVVGVGASLKVDENGRCIAARIALGAVGPRAALASDAAESLVGTTIDDEALSRAGTLAAEAAQPISDKRGTADYRREITAVLTRRVVATAARRAREKL